MAVVTLTKANFTEEVLESGKTVLIDFWAPWCGPCRMMSPVVDKIADDQYDGLKVCKVNIDEEPELAEQYGVMSIPTLVVLKDGELVDSSVGARPEEAVLKMVEAVK